MMAPQGDRHGFFFNLPILFIEVTGMVAFF